MRGKGHQRAESNRGKESVWGWRGNEAREQQQSLEANIKGDYLLALRSHMLTLAVVWTPDLLNSKHAKETCLVILATLATSRPRKNGQQPISFSAHAPSRKAVSKKQHASHSDLEPMETKFMVKILYKNMSITLRT